MPPKANSSAPSAPTFEVALERLEQIVEEMEGDNLPLERLLDRYEEGSKLLKVCQEKLEQAERRVELITRGAKGEPVAAPFEAPTTPVAIPQAPVAAPKPRTPESGASEVSLF